MKLKRFLVKNEDNLIYTIMCIGLIIFIILSL